MIKTAKDTLLNGFIPLVEASKDGAELEALPAQSLRIRAEERNRHLLVVGANGSGKTTRVVLPLILADIEDQNRSLVVIDAQLALTQSIVAHARKVRGRGARIHYFNPLDPKHSIRWNPIQGINDRAAAFDLAATLASGLPAGSGDSLYFRAQATLHIANLIRCGNRVGTGSLGAIRQVMEMGAKQLRQLGEEAGIPETVAFAKELEVNRNAETTLAEMNNLLLPWYDDRVVEVTTDSELDFDALERHPTILIIALPEESVSRLRPLTNSLIHRLFEWIMRRGQERGGALRRPIALHIDEFASAVGAINDFPLRANTLRKRGLMITAAIQTISQLQEVYPDAWRSLLAAFNHQIFIPRLAPDDAQYVAAQSGLTTVVETVTGRHGETQSVQPHTRPVLLPSEVDRPPRHPKYGPRMTFLFADTPPFQGYLPAVYELPEFQHLPTSGHKFHPPRRLRAKNAAQNQPQAPLTTPDGDKTSITTNAASWSKESVTRRIQELLEGPLELPKACSGTQSFWKGFVELYAKKLPVVLQFVEELAIRKATLTEFYLAYVESGTDNIQANLHYLDYVRLKRPEWDPTN